MQHLELTCLLDDPDALKARIRNLLAGRQRRTIPHEGLRVSAVLICICWMDSGPTVILTKRSPDVEHHKGEISFPGGSAEPHDKDAVGTALREAEEEIGLSADDVEVLGVLDDHLSIVGYHITPVVGWAPCPYEFRINSESEELLMLPLREVFREGAWMAERSFFKGSTVNLYFLEMEGGVVWGATARMLKHFADLLAGRSLPFIAVSESARAWVMNLIDSRGSYRNLR